MKNGTNEYQKDLARPASQTLAVVSDARPSASTWVSVRLVGVRLCLCLAARDGFTLVLCVW